MGNNNLKNFECYTIDENLSKTQWETKSYIQVFNLIKLFNGLKVNVVSPFIVKKI